MKIKINFRICTKFVKLGINKTIGHVNEAIQSEELEIHNEMTKCVDNQNAGAYDIKGR